jgi:hypothetical protein
MCCYTVIVGAGQFYAAMVNFLDGLVGRVVSALKAKGMWDNLLWVSSAVSRSRAMNRKAGTFQSMCT